MAACTPPARQPHPPAHLRPPTPQIALKVIEAAPSMKGETAAPSYKRAVVEGGVEVRGARGEGMLLASGQLAWVTQAQP